MNDRIKEILLEFANGCSNGRAGECAERLDAAVSAIAAVSGWQPIATVPKDGTIVDLWKPGEGRICNAYWADVFKSDGFTGRIPPWVDRRLGWRAANRGYDNEDGFVTWAGSPEPTHWMPRPHTHQHSAPLQ